ncbi:hypothetical protein BDN70DRAFT_998235 [Pholiota conissans]|uniref:Uncharacterized protein n=1 Tax=Pholiota conissans TaxID=109636 RepID=A0A9P5YNV8_9AGAR|nr:hypothetical protein BDN70DRAFT_998235 [Pholiota conissans]
MRFDGESRAQCDELTTWHSAMTRGREDTKGRPTKWEGWARASSPPLHPALATVLFMHAPSLSTHRRRHHLSRHRSLHLPLPWPPPPPHAVVNDDDNERPCPAPSIAHAPPLPSSLAIASAIASYDSDSNFADVR